MEFLRLFLRRHFEKPVVVSRNVGCFLRLTISLSPRCSCMYYLKLVEFKIKFSDFFLQMMAFDGKAEAAQFCFEKAAVRC